MEYRQWRAKNMIVTLLANLESGNSLPAEEEVYYRKVFEW